MPKRRASYSVGGGRYTTRTSMKRAGGLLGLGVTKGTRYYGKNYRGAKGLPRKVRGPAGTLKSKSKAGKRMIVGSLDWRASERKKRR